MECPYYFVGPELWVAEPEHFRRVASKQPDAVYAATVEEAVHLRAQGRAVCVSDFESAAAVLLAEGWNPTEVAFRISLTDGSYFA